MGTIRHLLMNMVMFSAALYCGCGQPESTLAGGKPIEYWLSAMKGSDARRRKEAVFKLGNVGSADPAAFPAVLRALEDPDASVRREAITAILKFGDNSRDAIGALTNLEQNDKNPNVREFARKALERVKELTDS